MNGGGHRDWSAVVGLASVVVALGAALVLATWRAVGLPRVVTVGSDPVPPRVVPNVGLVESVVAAFYLPRPMHWLDLGGLWTTNLRFDYADGSAVVARAHRGVTTPERLLAIQSAKTAARRSGLPVP